MSNPDRSDRSILITGCSSGIGLQAAKTLQLRGFKVFASVRRPQDEAQLQSLGLHPVMLDLDDSTSIRSALDKVLDSSGGKLYGLFNNAGYGQAGAVEDLPTDALRSQFETLVFGWHELTRQVIPVMRRQGHGRIVQNSSVLGFAAMPYRGAYNAAKFAIEGLSDSLRLELEGSNIHVSIIQPGAIRSRFRANALVKFQQHIDADNSVHKAYYQRTVERLQQQSDTSRFTLGPDAVVDKLLHALESEHPKVRYRVTTPTIVLAMAKRLLPGRVIDRILRAAA